MLVMITAKYPATSVRRAIELFMSPETPKRPSSGREVASFVHGDHNGYTNFFIFDVEDKSVGEFIRLQSERIIYMETRIPGLSADMKVGQSVQHAIAAAMPHLPK